MTDDDTDNSMAGDGLNKAPMSGHTNSEVQAAFNSLRLDSASADVDAAWSERAKPAQRPAPVTSRPKNGVAVQWLAAAAVLAVAFIGGIALLNRGDATVPVTVSPPAPTAVPEAAPEQLPPMPPGDPSPETLPGKPISENLEVAGEWTLNFGALSEGKVFYNNGPVPVTLEVIDGAVTGVAGCNTYRAALEDGGIGPAAATKIACADVDGLNIMAIEAEYLRALGMVDTVRSDPNRQSRLLLTGEGAVLDFSRMGMHSANGTAASTDLDYKSDDPRDSASPGSDFLGCTGDRIPIRHVATESNASAVESITTQVHSDECITTIITLRRVDGGVPTLLQRDLDVKSSVGSAVAISFAPDVGMEAALLTDLTRALTEDTVAVVTSDEFGAYVLVDHGEGETTVTLVDDSPVRILVDTRRVPNGSRPVPGVAILAESLNANGPVTMPLVVRGFGTGFEGAQSIALYDSTGSLVVANWSGVIGGEVTGTEAGVSVGNLDYSRFSFTLDDLAPGDYELRWLGVAGPPEGPEFLQVEPFTVQ